MISSSIGNDGETVSESGKCTFGFLSADGDLPKGEHYFLHPKRPLGQAWPRQFASRVRDPEGNYLAFASSMEEIVGRVPPVQSYRELKDCLREYVVMKLQRSRKRSRHFIDDFLDWYEYTSGRVTFIRRDLRGYTHVVASREGLYVVNHRSYKRILRGSFFGTTVKDGAIYCFQACGPTGRNLAKAENKGRILKISLTNDRIEQVDVLAKDLDDGCHQMDFIGEDLFVVDCYNGRILQITPDVPGYRAHYPLGPLSREQANSKYHFNSIAAHPDGTLWLLLHNKNRAPSEVLVMNRNFEVLRRFPVKAGAAHNIVFTNDEFGYLIADSSGARIVTANRVLGEIGMIRPRGISLDSALCVVGDSFFCSRPFRRYVPGRVHFFDRSSWECLCSLTLPAAPTEVRRIDGKDWSISNYLMSQVNIEAGHSPAWGPGASREPHIATATA